MSFGRIPGFDNDPFFNRDPFLSRDPFFNRSMGMGMGMGLPMLGFPGYHQPHGHLPDHHSRSHRRPEQQLDRMDPFSMMDKMMVDMMRQPQVGGGGGGGQYFSSSSVMQFSNSGGGAPKVYSATSSVTQGPGGVKETRKSECDSETGVKKMMIGHHIGDRAHTIEKKHDLKKKEQEQHQEFINLVEDESASFDREWQEKTRSLRFQPSLGGGHGDRDHYSSVRGISLPEIRTGPATRPGGGDHVRGGGDHVRGGGDHVRGDRVRDHRSRSPEKRKARSKATKDTSRYQPQSDHNTSNASRRREYVTDDGCKRKVHF